MSNQIHKTAIISEGAKIGNNNFIGPYCIVYPNAVIGDNNVFVSHCSIGSEPEHQEGLKVGVFKKAVIGNGNRFFQFVVIGCGAERDTIVGDSCFVMNGSYISHDTIIGNNVTLSSNSLIGGHSLIDDYANFGLGATCHQYSHIGMGAMLGMGAVVPKNKNIIPFTIYIGNPIRHLKDNKYLIDKLGFNDLNIHKIRKEYYSKAKHNGKVR
jgi:UDP-N-acetylglucosamine acyltransferase